MCEKLRSGFFGNGWLIASFAFWLLGFTVLFTCPLGSSSVNADEGCAEGCPSNCVCCQNECFCP